VTFISHYRTSSGDMTQGINQGFIDGNFPSLKKMVYLNNASTGITPMPAIEAMKTYLYNATEALGSFDETLSAFKGIRSKLARLLGGEASDYGFAPNTSEGLNAIAHGIEYPDKSNIVICDLEFPANYVPWQNASEIYNAELRVVQSEAGGLKLEDFEHLIDNNTRVVAISMVQFASGYRADISELAKIVHEHDALLVVDIIQAAGCLHINLPAMGVDFAAAQAAKWLIGPIGAGFVFVNRRIIDDLRPRYMGWWGVEDTQDFSFHQRTRARDATKFEVGSPAMIAYVGFDKSLDILLRIPGKERERAALDNADYLRERLSEKGIDYYRFDDENRSAIVSCAPDYVEDIQIKLEKSNIHCSVRNGRLRISPHFYNRRDDIDRLLDAMEV
jgi:cysteine desulfurase/selenocysteine lyase